MAARTSWLSAPPSDGNSPPLPAPACSVYWEFSHSGADGGRTGRNRTKMLTALSGVRAACAQTRAVALQGCCPRQAVGASARRF